MGPYISFSSVLSRWVGTYRSMGSKRDEYGNSFKSELYVSGGG